LNHEEHEEKKRNPGAGLNYGACEEANPERPGAVQQGNRRILIQVEPGNRFSPGAAFPLTPRAIPLLPFCLLLFVRVRRVLRVLVVRSLDSRIGTDP